MTAPLLGPVGAPTAPAVSSPGGPTLTYAELVARSEDLAERLAAAGMRHGDRVATVTSNSVEQVVLFFACARTGLVLVPLSWRAAAGELAGMIADAAPRFVAHDADHASLVSRSTQRPLAAIEDLAARIPRVGPPTPEVQPSPEDPVLLLFTSGSSGRPKGVPLSVANCLATNHAFGARFPIGPHDVVLQVLPQFHVGGWNVLPVQAWLHGAEVVVAGDFDATAVLDAIERHRVTALMAVPTVYERLAAEPGFTDRDLASLHTVVVGGAPVDASLGRAWAAHGVRLWQGYGLTEAAPNVLVEPDSHLAGPFGWMAPYDGVQVRLDGTGQLLVRGPGVMSGYWHDEQATRAVLRDGWLATGDLAEQSADGLFRLRGRASEKYISGGENVHPAEVEAALCRLPEVSTAAVVGVPDPRWGEAGIAFVVLEPGTCTTGQDPGQDLRSRVRAHLAGFKVPREIVVVTDLPHTGSGKVDKASLRRRLGPR